jgi:hypothetical protein
MSIARIVELSHLSFLFSSYFFKYWVFVEAFARQIVLSLMLGKYIECSIKLLVILDVLWKHV